MIMPTTQTNMTKSMQNTNNESSPLLSTTSHYKPPYVTKRRRRKDKHSRDGRKHRKRGKGGKLRAGGYTHRNSICGWRENFNQDFALMDSDEVNPLLILLAKSKQHKSVRVV